MRMLLLSKCLTALWFVVESARQEHQAFSRQHTALKRNKLIWVLISMHLNVICLKITFEEPAEEALSGNMINMTQYTFILFTH